ILAQRSGIAGGGGYRPPARVEHDERDKFRAASIDSLLVRGGIPVVKPAPGHDELMSFSLKELARDALRRSGQRAGNDPRDWVGRALTTSDLPNILMDVANKSIMFGWDSAPEYWQLFCATGQVSDFKPGHAVRLGEFDDLDEMTDEDPEYKYGSLKDAQESYQIATYGKAFRIDRKTVINDDLSMLTSIPQAMGEAASRTVGDVVWAAIISNAAMGDGKALFHADHSNTLEIAAFDVDGLGAAIMQMTAQMDMRKKRRIRVQPVFFLSPTALFVTAEKFFGSDVIGTAAEPNIRNPFTGMFSKERRIFEPRLDDYGVNVFYLAAAKGRTVTTYFLNGIQRPFMDAENDWSTDGRKFKVRIDVGAKAMDWRGLQRTTIQPAG
ncbi:MAG: peptidase U35, partial [Pseudomonadota bacterium]